MVARSSSPGVIEPHKRISRRHLLLGAAAAGLIGADAWLIEPRWIDVEHVHVPIDGLGSAWDQATVALLSDTHCGPYTGAGHIERAVEMTNAAKPDIVLLLGDYVHRGGKYIEPGIAPFARLLARDGIFAVLGNHDHWDGRDASVGALKRAGVDLLTNRSVVLRRRGESIAIGGLGDYMEDELLLGQTFRGCSQRTPRLLLEHNPDYAEVMPSDVRVDLMVCGHTHGGQVNIPLLGPPVLPSRYGRKYAQGFVQGPSCRVYVTRGVSTISPPIRLFCRPEITILHLAAG